MNAAPDPTADRVPVIGFRRAIVPGTRATVPAPSRPVAIGQSVVIVFESPEGTRGAVGTMAVVVDADTTDAGRLMLRVAGERLVGLTDGGGPLDVDARPDPTEAAALVAEVETLLRRYMAARAEAGEGGDVHVAIGPDPVAASHEVASRLDISWPEIQDIFEAGDAFARLRAEARVLARETALLHSVLARTGG